MIKLIKWKLYPVYGYAVIGAEVTDGAIHHGQMILGNSADLTLAAWEWSAYGEKS